jgi:hypothetical protein
MGENLSFPTHANDEAIAMDGAPIFVVIEAPRKADPSLRYATSWGSKSPQRSGWLKRKMPLSSGIF